MKLIKHYDFTKMTELDQDWTIEVGDKWANDEAQAYTDSSNNIYFDDGLVLKATLEDGVIKSARLKTKNKFSFTYGKIEIVAKVPDGKGTWPALWMMPEEPKYGHWPKSGEIDLMEHCGNRLNELFLCVHTEKYNHKRKEQYYKTVTVDGLTEDFQTFGFLWEEDRLTYLLNGETVVEYQKGEGGKDTTHKGWPFDQAYYLIMNLAMGGTFGGEIDYDSFPQSFIIKDVKVYQ